MLGQPVSPSGIGRKYLIYVLADFLESDRPGINQGTIFYDEEFIVLDVSWIMDEQLMFGVSVTKRSLKHKGARINGRPGAAVQAVDE